MTDPAFASAPIRDFAGCRISPVDEATFFERLFARLAAGERSLLIGHHNLHSLHLYHRQQEVQTFYRQCDDCYVDGVPVLWLLRLAGLDTRSAHRFSLMDCLPRLLDMAQERGLGVFYLGGSARAVERAEAWLSERWPRLRVALHHGYVEGDEGIVDRINEFAPDLLLVGLGMPTQERWILAHRARLHAGAVLQAGGTLDYYTGLQARPPETWSRLGLAWLYRLVHDPRRLWRRYLLTPWSLIRPLFRLRRALRTR